MNNMNTYHAFYNQKKHELKAATSYEAQVKAVEYFHPPKAQKHMVHVVLVAINGEPYAQSTAAL